MLPLGYLIIIPLLFLSALFSGSLIGLMSLDPDFLKLRAEMGHKDALKIYAIRKDGNRLLVTLLLANVTVNSVLATYVGSLIPGIEAALLSTFLITIFGEIIPMSIFLRYRRQISPKVSPYIRLLVVVMIPISYPFSWFLNKFNPK